jgi:hypothetical protein
MSYLAGFVCFFTNKLKQYIYYFEQILSKKENEMKKQFIVAIIAIIALLSVIILFDMKENSYSCNDREDAKFFIGTWKNFLPVNRTYFLYTGFTDGYTEWTFFNNGTLQLINTHTPFTMSIGPHDAIIRISWFDYYINNNNLTITSIDSNYSKIYDYEFDKNNSMLNLKLINTVPDVILFLGDSILPGSFELYRVDTTIFVEIVGQYKAENDYRGFNWIVDSNGTYYKINGLDDEYYINKTLKIKGFIVLPIKLPEEYFGSSGKRVYYQGFIQVLSHEVVDEEYF